VCFCV
jgi:hypothetical protein